MAQQNFLHLSLFGVLRHPIHKFLILARYMLVCLNIDVKLKCFQFRFIFYNYPTSCLIRLRVRWCIFSSSYQNFQNQDSISIISSRLWPIQTKQSTIMPFRLMPRTSTSYIYLLDAYIGLHYMYMYMCIQALLARLFS